MLEHLNIALAVVVTKCIFLGMTFFETYEKKNNIELFTTNFKHSFNGLDRIACF